MDRDELLSYGIDFDQGVKNCMGNPVFYKKILAMFLQDDCLEQAKTALSDGDQKTLFSKIHELKGMSGNAALPELYNAVIPLVELLRPGNAASDEIRQLFLAIESAYQRACEGIGLLIAE